MIDNTTIHPPAPDHAKSPHPPLQGGKQGFTARLSAREIAVVLAITDRGVRKQAAKEGWNYLEVIGKGGRKRKYIVGDLPEEVRLKVMKYYIAVNSPSLTLPTAGEGKTIEKNKSKTPPGVPLLTPAYQPVQAGEVYSSFSSPRLGGQHDAGSGLPGAASGAPTNPPSPLCKGEVGANPCVRPDSGRHAGLPLRKQDQLPAWAESIARARADLVAQYWKAREKFKSPRPPLQGGESSPRPPLQEGELSTKQVTDDFLAVYNSGIALPDLFRTLGQVARSTLERWRKDLEENKNDYTALAPRWGKHRSGVTVLSETESTVFFKQLLHPNRIKISKAIDLTKALLASQGIASDSSSTTFRRVAERFKSQYFDIWTLCREGEKALFDKVIPYMQRDDSLLEVGDVLVADGHRCNFFVHNPFNGKRCRPILVGFYDWKSRDLVGYAYSLNEDTQVIAAALYNAIRRLCKLPRIVLTDNGKAFKSRVFHGERDQRDPTPLDPPLSGGKIKNPPLKGGKEIDLEQAGLGGMFGRLGIQTIFAMPYNARSKPIERFFLEFGESFERYLPAYSGSNIADKPAYLMRNEKMMKEFFESEVFTLAQAVQALEQWLGLYRATAHPTVKDKRKIDVFEEGRGQGVDDMELRFLMMHAEVKRIDRNGVKFMQGDYYHEVLYGLREPVMIRYEFTDITRIHIYRRTGEFLCTAERRGSFHPMARIMGDAKSVSEVKAGVAQQRSLKRGTLKIARKIFESGVNQNLLDQIPYEHMPPSIPMDIERIQGEVEGPREWAKIPVVDVGNSLECGDTSPPLQSADESAQSKTGAEIVPLFTSRVEKYIYLSTKRQLTEEEALELEECKRAESVKDFMAMSRAVAQ